MLTKQIPSFTVFTVLAYAMAYSFQKGVASYYGYSDLFIKIDLNTLLYSSVWLLVFSFVFAGGTYFALVFDLKDKYYVAVFVFMATLLIPYFYIVGMHWPFGYFPEESVMHSGDFLYFAMLFLNYHNVVSSSIYDKRHQHNMETIKKTGKLSEYKTVLHYVDFKVGITAFIYGVVTLLILSYVSGKITAFKNDEYYMVDNSPSKVLLNSYSGGFVVGSCESRKAKFEFINDLKGLEFTLISSEKNIEKIKKCFETRVRKGE
ncbi:hypothetical protein JT624_004400 [Escherichia coli]|nr:hypothetical protein [Escherichia coli]